jgi:hypothetical protein
MLLVSLCVSVARQEAETHGCVSFQSEEIMTKLKERVTFIYSMYQKSEKDSSGEFEMTFDFSVLIIVE